MRIAIFGASGLTASECIFQALKAGHSVIGLTRNPTKLCIPKGSGGTDSGKPFEEKEDKLTLIAGDVTNPDDVAKIYGGSNVDGTIVALGGRTSDVGTSMLTDGTKNVVDAIKKHNEGKGRLVVVTSIGCGDSYDQAPFFFKILMNTMMKRIFADKNNQEKAVTESGLDYCLVRPGGLTVDPPTGVIHVIKGKAGSIARADVAKFCLDAIGVEDFPYLGQAPCLSSVGGTAWTKDRSMAARGDE